MPRKAGSADLPLHGGHVPKWLAARMTRLGGVISEAIVHHYGREELLRRLAHPFWFQSFGAVMGMDWHSSGITTSVIGALKCGLAPLQKELGIHVCGGRGKYSRRYRQINLSRAKRGSRRNEQSRCRDRDLPVVGGFGSEDPKRRSRDKMALEIEGIVDDGMHAEETLGGSSRFEPPHLALSSSHHLMRIFCPIILSEPLFMRAAQS